jgi:hypothetical protein
VALNLPKEDVIPPENEDQRVKVYEDLRVGDVCVADVLGGGEGIGGTIRDVEDIKGGNLICCPETEGQTAYI